MKAAFKYFFFYLLLMVGASMAVMMFLVPIMMATGQAVDADSLGNNAWFSSLALLGGDLVILLVFWKRKYCSLRTDFTYDFGEGFTAKKLYLWAAVGCLGCLLFDIVVQQYVSFPEWEIEELQMLADMMRNPIGLLTVCLTGPMVEEMVFRGAIERRLLEKNWNPWYAIVISSIFFAVAHFNLAQGATAIVMGIFLGWVYYRTRNLWPCIMIHALNNTLCCVITWCDPNDTLEQTGSVPIAVGALMLAVSAVLVYYGVKYINRLTKDRVALVAESELPPPIPADLLSSPVNEDTDTSQDETL